jgi:hypothetical protein
MRALAREFIKHDNSDAFAALGHENLGEMIAREPTNDSRPLLHRAIAARALGCCRVLLDAGAHVEQRDRHGITPLLCACGHHASAFFAAFLLTQKADPNAAGGGMTPLQMAVARNASDTVCILVRAGARVRDDPNLVGVAIDGQCWYTLITLFDARAPLPINTVRYGGVRHAQFQHHLVGYQRCRRAARALYAVLRYRYRVACAAFASVGGYRLQRDLAMQIVLNLWRTRRTPDKWDD